MMVSTPRKIFEGSKKWAGRKKKKIYSKDLFLGWEWKEDSKRRWKVRVKVI